METEANVVGWGTFKWKLKQRCGLGYLFMETEANVVGWGYLLMETEANLVGSGSLLMETEANVPQPTTFASVSIKRFPLKGFQFPLKGLSVNPFKSDRLS